MTIHEYRNDPARVKKAAKILSDPEVAEMLQIVGDSEPRLGEKSWGAVPPHDHSRMLGQIEGFQMALASLKALGIRPPEPAPQIRETYPAQQSTKPKR